MYPFIGPVPAYAIFYVGGIILHFVIARRIARRAGLKRRVWLAASVCYLLAMTLGAKVLFDLRHSDFNLAALLTVDRWTRGGLWGGLLAYFPLALPCALLLSERRAAAMDLVAASVPIPWIAAKLGCLLNGCCYGKACSLPWAITFPEGARGAPAGVPLHPTQLYEIGVMAILLAVFRLFASDRWRGTKPLWFVLIYGLGRALTDLLRGDMEYDARVGSLTTTQRICLGAAAGAAVVLAIVWRSRSSGGPALSLRQNAGQR